MTGTTIRPALLKAVAGREPEADRVVELDGALVTPAFVDTHVHITATGQALDGLDLTGCPSLLEALRRLDLHARGHADGIVLGHGWDETLWPENRAPTMAELDAVGGGREVFLSRTDAQAAVVTAGTLERIDPALPGYRPDGHLRLAANAEARNAAFAALTPGRRRRLQRVALTRGAGRPGMRA